VLLKEGKEVKLKLHDRITSKTAGEGRLGEFDPRPGSEGRGNYGCKGRISVAVTTVSHADKAGMLGRPGDLDVRLEYLKADDSTVRLRGTKGKQGKGKEGTAVALTFSLDPSG
jgi:hypothetical protein